VDDAFKAMLDMMAPSAGEAGLHDAGAPDFPTSLGFVPRGVIGRGGTGWVYRAYDPVLQREVAVKIARPEGGAQAREALLAEAQLTARLQHPAVVPVHRVIAAQGLLCLELRLAPVTTLDERRVEAQSSPSCWPLEERLLAMAQLADAIAGAHAAGVVHGDLHPGNIVLDGDGRPYLLDWSGASSTAGQFTGSPAWAAPELLASGGVSAAGDVFALGVIAWELCALRRMRAVPQGASLGELLVKWQALDAPEAPAPLEPALRELLADALARAPAQRPSAAQFRDRLDAVVTGTAERGRRQAEADALVAEARERLAFARGLERRLGQERQVLVLQRSKVPGWAPADHKRSLWAAEDRVESLSDARARALEHALGAALQASTLGSDDLRAREVLAEIWWVRLAEARQRLSSAEAHRAEDRLRLYDDGRYQALLDAPARLSVTVDAPDAVLAIAVWSEQRRALRPERVSEHPLPVDGLSLKAGSYLLTLSAPDRVSVQLPLALAAGEQRAEHVVMGTPAQVGDGWVVVPAGSFIMGGDALARMSVERCEPWLETFFIRRTAVTSGEWLAFLNALPVHEAEIHVPGEMGFFGGRSAFWDYYDGAWRLPPGWPEDLPAIGVSCDDVERYVAWRSAVEGRVVRLPTEEEWEKAARGVDGRTYPWGDHFDPTFAHMRRSKPGPPAPSRVGCYPHDVSPYGVYDMAGGVREWTGSVFDEGQMVIRGGTFGDDDVDLRCAGRAGFQPGFRMSYVGFRVVADGYCTVNDR